MSSKELPSYLASARRNPHQNRAPWYTNIAPSYVGVFMYVVFYETLGNVFLLGGLAAALVGLILAAVSCYLLFYLVYGLLGMKTGLPLYVVGSSTFGIRGGYFIPGILMGLLQIGWYSVVTFFATKLILQTIGVRPLSIFDPVFANRGFSPVFVIVVLVWGYAIAIFVGLYGIKYLARVGQILFIVPLLMLIIATLGGVSGLDNFQSMGNQGLAASLLMVQIITGFFATAGAAGADFGTNSRDKRDIIIGGFVGIVIPIVLAGGLTLLAVAGANGIDPTLVTYTFSGILNTVSPQIARAMFLLFVTTTIPSAGFAIFVMANSFSTMIPSVSRMVWTLLGATLSIILASLGLAGNLEPFFGLGGATFGPIGGAMLADYLLSGRRWSGPRRGVSIPGYTACIIGLVIGILNNDLVTALIGKQLIPVWHPTSLYSFIAGFIVYSILANMGLENDVVPLPQMEKISK